MYYPISSYIINRENLANGSMKMAILSNIGGVLFLVAFNLLILCILFIL
ncbi:hypothetical protein bcere0019_19450 [Bacillus cereus Rock3-28]|nr:hypothetical protein bcere0019_19450 [Bacillus cereus Rock3-28]